MTEQSQKLLFVGSENFHRSRACEEVFKSKPGFDAKSAASQTDFNPARAPGEKYESGMSRTSILCPDFDIQSGKRRLMSTSWPLSIAKTTSAHSRSSCSRRCWAELQVPAVLELLSKRGRTRRG